jgi:hypothetical protein
MVQRGRVYCPAETFLGPDWPAITLNAYRARWMPGEATDAHYNALQLKLREIDCLSTPTLMIQGASDFCDAPKESEVWRGFLGERIAASCLTK